MMLRLYLKRYKNIMANQIDNLDITGMVASDFDQLYQMYLNERNSGNYYGRKDYWDKRIERLDRWLRNVVNTVYDENTVIKKK